MEVELRRVSVCAPIRGVLNGESGHRDEMMGLGKERESPERDDGIGERVGILVDALRAGDE